MTHMCVFLAHNGATPRICFFVAWFCVGHGMVCFQNLLLIAKVPPGKGLLVLCLALGGRLSPLQALGL